MKSPDYNSYTLEQLLDVESKINRHEYPERYDRIISILNDPDRRLVLEAEQKGKDTENEKENQIAISYLGAFVYWIYGAVVLITGTLYTRLGDIYIESLLIRALVFIGIVVVGYMFLKSVLSKIENQ